MKNIKNNINKIKIYWEKLKISSETHKIIFFRFIKKFIINLVKNEYVYLGENPIPRIQKYCLTKDRS